jgi:hypothetical protein
MMSHDPSKSAASKGFFVLYLHNPDVEIAVLLCHLADGKDPRRSVNVSVG